MNKQHWIFLSPHFDDVALSCGGLVWMLAQQGHHVEVWTVMGGLPLNQDYTDFAQAMHQQWGMPPDQIVQTRRTEDSAACQAMGATPHHFNWPDVIYRKDPTTNTPQVVNNDELFGKSPELALVDEIARMISKEVPKDTKLVSPISLGNHIDHRAVWQAAEQSDRVDYYYADYPYILNAFDDPRLFQFIKHQLFDALSENALCAWQKAILCYASQLTMFWRDKKEAKLAIQNYLAGGGGGLWKKNQKNTHLDSPQTPR